jgi:hypothetical protein
MTNKLLVIISTAELGVARTGMMYAVNALKNLWMEDVKVFFFGPAQESLIGDEELQKLLQAYASEGGTSAACKYIADRDGTGEPTAALGVQVEYVGTMISDLINDGYIPMVW